VRGQQYVCIVPFRSTQVKIWLFSQGFFFPHSFLGVPSVPSVLFSSLNPQPSFLITARLPSISLVIGVFFRPGAHSLGWLHRIRRGVGLCFFWCLVCWVFCFGLLFLFGVFGGGVLWVGVFGCVGVGGVLGGFLVWVWVFVVLGVFFFLGFVGFCFWGVGCFGFGFFCFFFFFFLVGGFWCFVGGFVGVFFWFGGFGSVLVFFLVGGFVGGWWVVVFFCLFFWVCFLGWWGCGVSLLVPPPPDFQSGV